MRRLHLFNELTVFRRSRWGGIKKKNEKQIQFKTNNSNS